MCGEVVGHLDPPPLAAFEARLRRVAERFGYEVRLWPVGSEDGEVGTPVQQGVLGIGKTVE